MVHDWEVIEVKPWVLQPENGAVVQGDVCHITYSCTSVYERVVVKPKLTQAGEPYKSGETIEVPETEDRVETYKVTHERSSFGTYEDVPALDKDGKTISGKTVSQLVADSMVAQTDDEWYANIRGEIKANLGGYNKELPVEIDITASMV